MKGIHTHYDNLKVARNAPPEVIRAAYKVLCQQFHPDRHAGHPRATQTFQIINAAYDVLSDPARRQKHDECIARTEARDQKQGQAQDRARDEERKPPRWNGRERRRRPWPYSTASGASATSAASAASRVRPRSDLARSITERIPLHLRILALWSSIALTGGALILIYHL